ISEAAQIPYDHVYTGIGRPDLTHGCHPNFFVPYLYSLGWRRRCRRKSGYPSGRLILESRRHFAWMVDGVLFGDNGFSNGTGRYPIYWVRP
ncbi:MAG TPA: hypothetical protein VG758_31320, partial [Hyphomicrobiaceae bacterium]|nr:hypothetical protein [Hyphomicrobiaceae bacterium]